MTKHLRHRAVVFCLLLALPASLWAWDDAVRSITVTGSSEMEVEPDRVSFDIELVSLADEMPTAKHNNDVSLRKVLDILDLLSISKDHIEITSFSVAPNYIGRWPESKKKGYRAKREIRMKLDSLDQYHNLMDALLSAGVEEISGVVYTNSKIEFLKDQVQKRAIENALSKARVLAEACGLKLGKILAIEQGHRLSSYGYGSSNSISAAMPFASVNEILETRELLQKDRISFLVTVTCELVE